MNQSHGLELKSEKERMEARLRTQLKLELSADLEPNSQELEKRHAEEIARLQAELKYERA